MVFYIGYNHPFASTKNILQHNSEVHPDICNCKTCWCIGHWRRGVHGHKELVSNCACARGTGAQVCMCMGHWRPVVHVHVAPASKCACAVGIVKTLKP